MKLVHRYIYDIYGLEDTRTKECISVTIRSFLDSMPSYIGAILVFRT